MVKSLHKILLILIKYIPFILGFIYFLNTILICFDIYVPILSWFGFTAFIPLIFILVTSFSFEFCIWHRLPLYYILFYNILNFFIWEWEMSVGLIITINTLLIGTLIGVGAYLKNKRNEQDKINKRNSTNNNK